MLKNGVFSGPSSSLVPKKLNNRVEMHNNNALFSKFRHGSVAKCGWISQGPPKNSWVTPKVTQVGRNKIPKP